MRAVSAGMLLAAAFCPAVSGQQVWSNLWPSAHGMDAIDAELAADDDNTTQMRVFAPIRAGASLSVDLRSAVKVTHVVRIVPRTPPWAAAGCCWLLLAAAGCWLPWRRRRLMSVHVRRPQLLVEHPDEYLRAGTLTVHKNGRKLTVASWSDEEMGRTRTPAGHTVIALSPPLKLVHAPFVFNIEVAATQRVGCERPSSVAVALHTRARARAPARTHTSCRTDRPNTTPARAGGSCSSSRSTALPRPRWTRGSRRGLANRSRNKRQ
jgi:hypothetical protein